MSRPSESETFKRSSESETSVKLGNLISVAEIVIPIVEKAIRAVAEYSRHAAILYGGAPAGNGRVWEDFSRITVLTALADRFRSCAVRLRNALN